MSKDEAKHWIRACTFSLSLSIYLPLPPPKPEPKQLNKQQTSY